MNGEARAHICRTGSINGNAFYYSNCFGSLTGAEHAFNLNTRALINDAIQLSSELVRKAVRREIPIRPKQDAWPRFRSERKRRRSRCVGVLHVKITTWRCRLKPAVKAQPFARMTGQYRVLNRQAWTMNAIMNRRLIALASEVGLARLESR